MTLQECFDNHRKMWYEMLRQLGFNPSVTLRYRFKQKYFQNLGINVKNDCYLCEFACEQWKENNFLGCYCDYCPGDWGSAFGVRQYKCEDEESELDWTRSSLQDVAEIKMKNLGESDGDN